MNREGTIPWLPFLKEILRDLVTIKLGHLECTLLILTSHKSVSQDLENTW